MSKARLAMPLTVVENTPAEEMQSVPAGLGIDEPVVPGGAPGTGDNPPPSAESQQASAETDTPTAGDTGAQPGGEVSPPDTGTDGLGAGPPLSEHNPEITPLPENHTAAGSPGQDELAGLRAEVGRLREQLAAQQESLLRLSREAAEFAGLFPDQKLSSVPDEVWEEVKKGIPLAAAYAYHQVRCERQAAVAAEVNSKNTESSAGPVDGRGRSEFYSPAEVRTMSAAEVRANFDRIVDSMKLWS